MANPNRISNGEVIARKYQTRTTYQFPDSTEYSTALVHYGSFWDTTIQAGSTTTPTPMYFNTHDGYKGVLNGADGKIFFDHGGVYNFVWSGQFENSVSSDHDIYVWFRINGVNVDGSTGLAAVPASHGVVNGHAIIGWNFFLTVNAGDYVQIMWLKDIEEITMPFYAATASYPSTASVVLTVNQIA
jgi:hypothetical protein